MNVLIATQGVQIQTMLDAFKTLLVATSGLNERMVVRWDGDGRPDIEGRGAFIWYSLEEEIPDKSQGPGRFGNRVDPAIVVHYSTRSFADTAQRDQRRWTINYEIRWKLIQALQNNNLFTAYLPQPTLAAGEIWQPPAPTTTAVPLTIEPMYLAPIPRTNKNNAEEGTIVTSLRVVLPMVLALTNGEGIPP